MLVRRIARPLLAAWFVSEGVEAVRRPADHVRRAQECWRRLASSPRVASRVDVPEPPADRRVALLVRLHGAVMVLAALHLAFGRHPRTAALGLAALTVPLAVANQPLGGSDRVERAERRTAFWRNLSMIGGALIAGVDLEGRPGVTWRVENALADRAAAREAHAAATS